MMKSFAIVLFFISTILFFGTIHYWIAYKKPGVYPPKQVLRNRAFTLFVAGGVLLGVGSMISYFI
jgi:hypothetical protein